MQGKIKEAEFLQAWDESADKASDQRNNNNILLHGPVPYSFTVGAQKLSSAAGIRWENRITLESLYHISKVDPKDHIRKIAPKPMLYLAASKDPFSGPFKEQRKVFEAAGREGKEFVRLLGRAY